MMRLALTGGLMVLLCAGGCTAPEAASSDTDFELQRLENENRTLSRDLNAERSRIHALQQRVEAAESEWTTARAEAAAHRAQLAKVTQAYEALEETLEQRVARPLERPQVAPSLLPDSVDRALQTWAGRHAGRVWYDPSRAAISFANDKLFQLGSDTVRDEAMQPLRDLATVLTLVPADYEIIVVGHTDKAPVRNPDVAAKHPTNWHLSVHRAISVKDVLVQAGLAPDRFAIMGYGPYRPVSGDAAQNRRVEIFIMQKGVAQPLTPVRPS